MAVIAISFFITVSWLAVKMDARPSSTASVLSQIARGAFPAGSPGSVGYYLVQAFTLAILVLAANTSYQGFPRLAALLARDRFLPSQFVNLGDRLAYSNGIIVLAGLATLLLVAFRANVNSLIHLYVIGVFTAFTLAQAGMVRHWQKTRERGWRWRAALNALGAATTALVTVVVVATKFLDGAWMVLIAIPVLVLAFYGVRRHYRAVGRRLRAKGRAVLCSREVENNVVLYVERLDAATREALWYAQTISKESLRAIHVPFPGSDPGIGPRFFHWTDGNPRLEILPADGDRLDAVLEEIWAIPQGESRYVTVVVPELFRKPSLLSAVMRRSTFSLKLGLLREPGVAVTDVPKLGDDDVLPQRAEVVVPISGVNAASLRALLYARSLGIRETRAVYFAEDDDEVGAIEHDWRRFPTGLPLEIVEAPFRDVGTPLLTYLRGDHRRPGRRRRGRDARARRARHRPAAAQPAGALPEAAAALRAAGDPDLGSVPADLGNRQHDLAELLAGLHPLVRGARLGEREHGVDDRLRAAALDQLVGRLEVLARAHRRAVDRQLLPPDPVQARPAGSGRWSRRRRRSGRSPAPPAARSARSPRRRARARPRRPCPRSPP